MHILKTHRLQQGFARLLSLALLTTLAAQFAYGQAIAQISQQIDSRTVTPLKGSVHPLVRNGAKDLGVVPDSTPTGRITLQLKRPAAQEHALQKFLSAVHQKGSPSYHKWLTPTQFGQQFGVADSDLSAVQSWLESQGLKVEKVTAGRSIIEFSGTAAQVGAAFHTSLHSYTVSGETHHSNSSELQIPAALSSVVAAVGPLNDFHPKSMSHLMGSARFNPKSHQLTPQFTLSVPDYDLGLAPEDLATQYDIKPLYSAGVTGVGQTIGIINASNIDLNVVAAYRKLFGLDANPLKPNLPEVVIDGDDPGITPDSIEAYLDVEVSGAIAPQATVRLYIGASTDYSDGLSLAIVRAVEDDSASVLNLSFGGCEAQNTSFIDAFANSEWEQAAAQGQTVLVSSGDSDSAGCDLSGIGDATEGRQVSGTASTPWNIAVGGTDFYYPGGLSSVFNFWSQTNDGKNGSLLQPLPEQPWNNSIYGKNLFGFNEVQGGGGGQSACAIPGSGSDPLPACAHYSGYPKPAWQTGPGVPADGVRDLPDVSMFAATGDNASSYVICAAPGDCTGDAPGTTDLEVTQVGGTSAAAPVFAGVMTLVNQRYGPQGQANTVLYPLAQQVPSVFHDITVGSNNAPCFPFFSPIDCVPDASGRTYSIGGWSATPGYDLASGLGSVDANQLVANWDKVTFAGTSTTLTASSTEFVHGQPVTLNTIVTGSSGTPTGDVALVSNLPQYSSTGFGVIALNAEGDGTITTNQLPGGSYSLTAQYGGDAKYGGSQSEPISFRINPERSVIRPTVTAYTISAGAPEPINLGPVTNGASYPYGTAFTVVLEVTGATESASTVGTPATGSTALFDHGLPISTNSLDTTGSTYYSNFQLPLGQHSFAYAYSGNSSYLPTLQTSQPAPLNFTITKAPSIITSTESSKTISTGDAYVFRVLVGGAAGGGKLGGGAPPTGEVTFTLGDLPPEIVDLIPENGEGLSFASSLFTNLPAGSYPITVSYPGDRNWESSVLTGPILTVVPSAELPSFTTATLTSSSGSGPIGPSTILTLNFTVSGGPGATVPPTGEFAVYDNANLIGLTYSIQPSGGNTATYILTIPSSNLHDGTNQLLGVYAGDSNYQLSYSPLVSLGEHTSDFTLAATTQNITLRPGGSGIGFLKLQGLESFSGGVSLSCTVTGGPTGNTVMPSCVVPPVAIVQTTRPSTSIMLVNTESRGQRQSVPPGTYTAVITGTTGVATHDVSVTIVVQDPISRW
jgi:trimeric autotransporter adhesin